MILSGKDAAAALNEKIIERVNALKAKHVEPKLAIVRIGANPDDLSYERGAIKRAEMLGVTAQVYEYPADIENDAFLAAFKGINADPAVHGILLFRPLPKHIDDAAVIAAFDPAKDIDGVTTGNMAAVYAGTQGFAPCTAESCMSILEHYNVDLKGKKVVIVGRSLVIGKPLAMMMMGKNATVTVCHSKTADLPGECRRADVLVAAIGRGKMIGADYVSEGTVVVDVGINFVDGKMCGDVDFDAVQDKASAITPVPGGVGAMTTSILIRNVVTAAERANA